MGKAREVTLHSKRDFSSPAWSRNYSGDRLPSAVQAGQTSKRRAREQLWVGSVSLVWAGRGKGSSHSVSQSRNGSLDSSRGPSTTDANDIWRPWIRYELRAPDAAPSSSFPFV
ncbi:unnamed protein product, partial [Ilex paraguariensis]